MYGRNDRSRSDDRIIRNGNTFKNDAMCRDPDMIADAYVSCVIDARAGLRINDGMGIAGSHVNIVCKHAVCPDLHGRVRFGHRDVYIFER